MSNQRFLSLDVFRGMTICLMIIVNTPGDGAATFAPFLHAKWDGFTPTDLVFPSFLFAVGNAMSFVLPKWEKLSNATVLFRILKRTALIFLLGYLMYWFPFTRPMSDTRILGVLQRIALCYGFASLIAFYMHERVVMIVAALFLLTYWYISMAYGAPSDPLSITGNVGIAFDKWFMGESHMYHGEGFAFDPEGWVSTLPAIVNVLIGFIVGKFIQEKGKTYEGLTHLLMWGAGFVFLAFMWNYQFPINKKLWSSSFVLLTVGLDMIIIATIIYRIELHHQHQFASFFEIFGKNPLIIYLFSELLVSVLYLFKVGDQSLYEWIYTNGFAHFAPYWASFAFAISYMLVCWLLGYILNKYKIYIRV
jgi:predicted acyltransferase